MNHSKTEFYFLLVFLLGIFAITFFIFKPFLFALILAIIFATVFEPVHKKILRIVRGRNAFAALLSSIAILTIVIVPLIFLGAQIFRETTQLYSSLVLSGGTTELSRSVNNALQSLTRFSPIPITFSVDVNHYVQQGIQWLLQNLGSLFASVTKILLDIFVFLIALYYSFKDGHKLKRAVIALSPLQDVHNERIFNKLAIAINSVIKGNFVVALVQGLLTAIGFFIFGVPNIVLWGSVAAVAALVPGVGTSLVLIPGVLYLFFIGNLASAVGLLIWGMLVVGLIDNFLRPKLVEREVRIHSLLILLSILGGIGFFGPIGFLLGPLVLSMFFALFEIYATISKEYRE